ncbi:uncharacterized protein isoform X2 [Leptinotarsa decemlineata]|uniref:uncharacterized protein isoform X2 n=1 Tax=Leptinotarsa decemlineata TaxID=7539 RepID=UPI000C253303|nr:probable G-protein coupled receptor Mth-like 14 isoform X2 [Leptinotarsa decemlineata]
MKCVWCCFQTVMILVVCHASSGQEKETVSDVQVRLPKCCEINETFDVDNKTCSRTTETVNYEHFYFDTNQTHIGVNRTKFTPTFFKRSWFCPKGGTTFVDKFEHILGITSNASLIEHSNGKPVLPFISSEEYCASESNGKIAFFVCLSGENVNTAEVIFVYLPFLILSTVCYFCSAMIYWFILKVKEIHKKCFIGYALSMGVTFSFLVTFQTMNGDTGCEAVGGLFSFSIITAFSWLTCQCFEIMIMVRRFREESNDDRFRFYIAATLIIPILILLISLIPTGEPDLPDPFIKSNGNQMCNFEGANVLFFFIVVGTLLICCLLFLMYNFYQVNRNETKFRNNFNWLEKRSQFMYISRSCFLIWLTSTIWIVDIIIRETGWFFGNPDVCDVIESLQGIFTVAIFVTNRYTRKEIWAKLTSDSSATSEHRKRLGTFNWIMSHLSLKNKSSPENPEEERVSVDK